MILISLSRKPENQVVKHQHSPLSIINCGRSLSVLVLSWRIVMLISLIVVLLVSSSQLCEAVVAESLNVTQIELGEGGADLSSVYWHHKVYIGKICSI